jgi:hypothetical protein
MLGAAGVFVVLLAVYHATLIPTVVDQDSGELVAAAHVLGIPHPTGYPLWALLGRAFDYLPVGGTSAYRVAMLSAVSTAAAGAIVAALGAGLAGAVVPGMLAGLAFGLWFPAWSQAVRAEVYGLTALLVALSLAALLKWNRDRSPRNLAWFSLACGFVSMHHRTAMLAVAPALVMAVVLTLPRRARSYIAAGALFLAPFFLYAYLPLRAATDPPANWSDPVTWGRFWDHVLASQYTGYAFSHSLSQMAAQAEKLTPEMLLVSPWLAGLLAVIGLPLIAWGVGDWTRKQPEIGWSLAAGSALLCFWVLQWGETTDLKVFFHPLGEIVALWWAAGLGCLAGVLPKSRTGQTPVVALGLVVCGMLLVGNWGRADQSNLWQHRDRWAAMLSELEQNAIFISDNDVPSFATMYLQTVEGMRPDVALVRVVPLPTDWYVGTLPEGIREAVRQSWTETELTLADPSRYKWERAALFAYLLAKGLKGSRPVYVLHGPMSITLPGPPYFVGVSEDLAAVRFERPGPKPGRSSGTVGEFPGGIELAEFELERMEAGTGERIEFRSRWRVASRLPGPVQFALRLTPLGLPREKFEKSLLPKGRFTQAFPLLASQWDLAPLPEGDEFEQTGALIVPTNCPPGVCSVEIGIGPLYSPENVGWTTIGEIQVQGLAAPTNKP